MTSEQEILQQRIMELKKENVRLRKVEEENYEAGSLP
jgi:hypothetical protein